MGKKDEKEKNDFFAHRFCIKGGFVPPNTANWLCSPPHPKSHRPLFIKKRVLKNSPPTSRKSIRRKKAEEAVFGLTRLVSFLPFFPSSFLSHVFFSFKKTLAWTGFFISSLVFSHFFVCLCCDAIWLTQCSWNDFPFWYTFQDFFLVLVFPPGPHATLHASSGWWYMSPPENLEWCVPGTGCIYIYRWCVSDCRCVSASFSAE